MNESVEKEVLAPATVDARAIQLGQWMGRREAFGLVAGRCSSADVESLRSIREGKTYALMGCTWDEFCASHLHVVRRRVDREIGYLREFGPAFFTVRQLTHVSVKEYRAIAPQISEDGVRVDGKVVALLPENSEPLAAAVEELLRRSGSEDREVSAKPFEGLLKRCQATGRALRSFEQRLDAKQRAELVAELVEIRNAGEALGARFIDVRLEVRQ